MLQNHSCGLRTWKYEMKKAIKLTSIEQTESGEVEKDQTRIKQGSADTKQLI